MLRISSFPWIGTPDGTFIEIQPETGEPTLYLLAITKRSPFGCFKSSPEFIRLVAMMYVRFPFLLRNVEDFLHERGIDVSHSTIRFCWNRFGPVFAAQVHISRTNQMLAYSNWHSHLDNVFVKINEETLSLWRALNHEREV